MSRLDSLLQNIMFLKGCKMTSLAFIIFFKTTSPPNFLIFSPSVFFPPPLHPDSFCLLSSQPLKLANSNIVV